MMILINDDTLVEFLTPYVYSSLNKFISSLNLMRVLSTNVCLLSLLLCDC